MPAASRWPRRPGPTGPERRIACVASRDSTPRRAVATTGRSVRASSSASAALARRRTGTARIARDRGCARRPAPRARGSHAARRTVVAEERRAAELEPGDLGLERRIVHARRHAPRLGEVRQRGLPAAHDARDLGARARQRRLRARIARADARRLVDGAPRVLAAPEQRVAAREIGEQQAARVAVLDVGRLQQLLDDGDRRRPDDSTRARASAIDASITRTFTSKPR